MVDLLQNHARRKGLTALFAFAVLIIVARVSNMFAAEAAQADEIPSPVTDPQRMMEALNAHEPNQGEWRSLGGDGYSQSSYYRQSYYQGYYQSTYYGQGTYYTQGAYYNQAYYQGLYYNQAGYYGQATYYGQGYYQSSYTQPVGIFSFEYEPNGYCVRVTIRKSENHPRTVIQSDGYNVPCDEVSVSARALQRSVVLQY